MEAEELKRKLLGLWEKTTHNSKELLSVLFDFYFDTKYIEYKETDGKIVSALCGIPYTFGYGQKTLKGLYIISLSSEEGFRKKGILSQLLDKFNHRMKDEFDFSFIRPQTDLLADYFGTQGYFSSFFILEERFTPFHDFKNDYFLMLTDSDERIRKLKLARLDDLKIVENNEDREFSSSQIIRFIEEVEKKTSSSVSLLHTPKDLEYILSPDSIRHLNSFIAYDSDGKIAGITFIQKEDLKRIRVVANYVDDYCSYYALLDFIKRQFPDHSISINNSDSNFQIHSIIQQTYASANPEGGDLDNTFSTVEIPFNLNKLLQPLGMVKILKYESIIEFIAETNSDVDFKLYLRDLNADIPEDKKDVTKGSEIGEKTVFVVKNGKCHKEYVEEINKPSILTLNKKELSELLLRKNDSSNLIMEAFGIPRLNLQMKLLPV